MSQDQVTGNRASIRRHLKFGTSLVVFLVVGVGGWAATADISGAIIAPGTLVVDSNVKKVQHLSGGIIGELLRRDGDRVKAGDVLVRLDSTLTRANLAIVVKALDELRARKARLEAERDGAEKVAFPMTLLQRAGIPEVAKVIEGEQRLFEIRQSARLGQKAQLTERVGQLVEEIGGHVGQEQSKNREILLIQRELVGARELWDKNLMPISKLTSLEREETRLKGEHGQLVSSIAQVKGKVSETELQIVQIDRELSGEVARELREIDGKIGEAEERIVAAQDQLARIDIRAPQDGKVHQSMVHTIGGVITAGEVIMMIVPENENLIVEAKVAPQDIDQIQIGQKAIMRFSAFNQRTTPEIEGEINRISPDISTDPRSGQSYYTIRIAARDDELGKLGSVVLKPGMPVESFIKTSDRKFLSYLVKPLSDQITRAFRGK
jgi:HlyD family secretion protein